MGTIERINKIAELEGVKITALEKIIGASKGVLSRALKNKTDIQSKWISAIVENYPQYDSSWLLTGKGEMIRKTIYDPYTSIENEVVNNSPEQIEHNSEKYSKESLMQMSNRIGEICNDLNYGIQDFAKKIGYSYTELMQVISGNKPVTDTLVIKITEAFPEINPIWIFTGKGSLKNQKFVHNDNQHIVPKVVTVDKTGNDNIVMVPIKAAAGYLDGYGDPEFINQLPTYHLPNIHHGTYRMFQVNGHSMYPTLHDNGFVVGEWVENWYNGINDDRVYVVVSKSDGVVVKRILNRLEKYGSLYCKSDNRREYPNFGIDIQNIVEVWEVKMALSFELPNPAELYDRLNDLESEIIHLKSSLNFQNK